MNQRAATNPEQVRATLDELLAAARPKEPNRFWSWLAEQFQGAGGAVDELALVALIVFGALAAFLIWRGISGRSRAVVGSPLHAHAKEQVRLRVEALREQAARAREAGDYVLALRFNLFALVVGLGEHGDLEYRSAWTNRELIDRGEPRPEIRRTLSALLDELDPLIFGHTPAERADVSRMESVCDELLGSRA